MAPHPSAVFSGKIYFWTKLTFLLLTSGANVERNDNWQNENDLNVIRRDTENLKTKKSIFHHLIPFCWKMNIDYYFLLSDPRKRELFLWLEETAANVWKNLSIFVPSAFFGELTGSNDDDDDDDDENIELEFIQQQQCCAEKNIFKVACTTQAHIAVALLVLKSS